MKKFAHVIIDINHSAVDRIFEYTIPQEFEALCKGSRVKVPFGNSNKTIEGYIVGISDVCSFEESKIKPIAKTIDHYSVLQSEQIDLAYFMQETYNCSLVDALRLMIPSQLRNDKIKIKTATAVELCKNVSQKEIFEFIKTIEKKAPKQKQVLELLCSLNCELMLSEILLHIPNAQASVKKLEEKKIVTTRKKEILRSPFLEKPKNVEPNVPTKTQQDAIDIIDESIDNGGENYLLHGITGSGKTEVYMRCISHCILKNKTAIMLVPEIALTPQTVDRFRSRFKDQVAVLHSRLSAGERYDEWRRIRFGAVKVVVGARSAVFAPFNNLGLIIVDEEHESSYKSDKTPRYDAIEVAKKRCEFQKATLLLGSATPSLESYFKMKNGEYKIIKLKERINNIPLPKVKIVDMRSEFSNGNKTIFSALLYSQIKEALKNKNQIILFINRRGYASFVSCRGCGKVLRCPNCDVSLTYHKNCDVLRCHYCNYEIEQYSVCPSCEKPYLKHFGVGTQQVQEQVNLHFPGVKTLRMDFDTTQTKNAHEKILSQFSNREADILIGTQMIAKGLDFPQVTLVGVIAADASLFVPDYRSAERTFSLLTQVEGRAGRDKTQGRVVVQTYAPENPSIVLAANHDYERFYDYEINCRKENEFPPFADFLRFVFVGEDDEAVRKRCEDIKIEIQSLISGFLIDKKQSPLIYIAATKAPINYINNVIRYQLLIKLRRNDDSAAIIRIVAHFAKQNYARGVPNLEINPQNMT